MHFTMREISESASFVNKLTQYSITGNIKTTSEFNLFQSKDEYWQILNNNIKY